MTYLDPQMVARDALAGTITPQEAASAMWNIADRDGPPGPSDYLVAFRELGIELDVREGNQDPDFDAEAWWAKFQNLAHCYLNDVPFDEAEERLRQNQDQSAPRPPRPSCRMAS